MIDTSIITQPIVLPDFEGITADKKKLASYFPHGVAIRSVDEQETVLNLIRDGRAMIASAKAKFKAIKDPMNAAKNAVLALEHDLIDPMEDTVKMLSKANSDWLLEQEREARRKAAEEAERIRQENEAKALEEAVELDAMGASDLANDVIEEAIAAPAPVVVPIIEKARVTGVQSRASYSCQVTDLKALAEYCLANPALLPLFIQANDVALNQQARAQKENFNIPGCELVKKYV